MSKELKTYATEIFKKTIPRLLNTCGLLCTLIVNWLAHIFIIQLVIEHLNSNISPRPILIVITISTFYTSYLLIKASKVYKYFIEEIKLKDTK